MREESKSEDKKLDINQIIDWLQEDGMLTAEGLEKSRQYAGAAVNRLKHPLKVLADCELADKTQQGKVLSQEDLTQWLAKKLGIAYYYFDPLKIDVPAVTSLFSKAYTSNYNILPIAVNEQEVVVATAEPSVRSWQEDLGKMHKGGIRCVFSNPDEIKRYIEEFYNFSKSLKGAGIQAGNENRSAGQNLEQLVELSKISDLDANNQHVVNLVNWLLQYAFDQRASDIHIEPRRVQGNVRFRIDGVLHNVYQLPMPIMSAVLSRIKILGRMNIAEKRLPQDGRIKTQNPQNKEIDSGCPLCPLRLAKNW